MMPSKRETWDKPEPEKPPFSTKTRSVLILVGTVYGLEAVSLHALMPK